MIEEGVLWVLLALGALGTAFVIHFFIIRRPKEEHKQPPEKEGSASDAETTHKNVTSKNATRTQIVKGKGKGPEKHPLQAADLRGHTGAVLDLEFSLDGKYLASCSTGWWCSTELKLYIAASVSVSCVSV